MKLAVLDKDGTLTKSKSGNTFVQNPTDQVLMDGVVDGCKWLLDNDYMLAIASNQGGVEAGHKTHANAVAEVRYCMRLLENAGVDVVNAMFCPDFNGNKCTVVGSFWSFDLITESINGDDCVDLVGEFRKPLGGMLKAIARKGAEKHTYTDFLMIGDREEDLLAAGNAGFVFLDANKWQTTKPSLIV